MSKPTIAAWEQDEFWKQVVNLITGGKKLRSDAYLNNLGPEELQALLSCLQSGLPYSEQVKAAPKVRGGAHDGKSPSDSTLSEISKAVRQVWVLNGLERQQLLNAATKKRGQQLGLDSKLVDTVLMVVGEEALAQHAAGVVGGFSLKAAGALMKREGQIFAQERFKESLRTKLETALDALAEHIKGNPKAQAAYETFKATIAETTK